MLRITGKTRVNIIVGDPIAQAKSPEGLTRNFVARGHDGVVIPIHISAADLPAFLDGINRAQNLDGIVSTVPHKFACYQFCTSATERAHFLRGANVMRRTPDGGWHGDMTDGEGLMRAISAEGISVKGKRALVLGAGGAGSAIARALADAGVAQLAVGDTEIARRDDLIRRLADLRLCPVEAGGRNPAGFDLVVNATPLGTRAGDPPPFDLAALKSDMFVSCLTTGPTTAPLIEAARALGCKTTTGQDLFAAQQGILADFLLGIGG